MKKVLIISYLFAPRQEIGAIRWTKLAKYLDRSGVAVDVITYNDSISYDELLARDAAGLRGVIHRIDHSSKIASGAAVAVKPHTAPVEASVKGIVNKIKRCGLTRRIREKLREPKVHKAHIKDFQRGEDFCEQAIRYIKENNIDPTAYDSVVASYGPIGCALLALKLKELYPEMRLVMDFRDPMSNYMQSREMRNRCEKLQDELCEKADVIIAISKGNGRKIVRGRKCEKLHIITNGFDADDIKDIPYERSDKLSFCSTGSLYDGQRDTSDLFMVLAELVKNGVIKREQLRFDYAGRNFAVLAAQAQKYGMGDILCDHGELSRIDCLRLQRNSRFLVFNTWNFKNNEGILPGKIFEYMMMHRPIIGVVTGRLPNSEAREVVERAKAGIVFERGDFKACKKALYSYLAEDCERFVKGLDCAELPQPEAIAEYEYANIAARIEKLL